MRERGFRAALRFYGAHFTSVFALTLVFYIAIGALALVLITQLGYYAILTLAYLALASIFWLQAPLARLVDDVRNRRPNPGVRSTFESLYPKLGSITAASFLAAVAVYVALGFLIVPGLILLARWALIIPVIVLEGRRAFQAFGRSNALVRNHTGRVVVELLVSSLSMIVIWSIAIALLAIPSVWVSTPLALAFLTLATPPIPLMRTLSYYDLVDAAAKRERAAEAAATP